MYTNQEDFIFMLENAAQVMVVPVLTMVVFATMAKYAFSQMTS
jgi:hypothetical protein